MNLLGALAMLTHVMVGVDDLDAAKIFYDAILAVLGHGPGILDGTGRAFYPSSTVAIGIGKPANGEPASVGNGGTIGFAASSAEQVDAWHAAGVAAGGTTCENPPGIRDLGPAGKIYAAYLRDPAGNKLAASFRVG